jgi:uncharacterized membrane protein
MESVIVAILVIAIVGFLVYLITKYVKMAEPFRDVIVAFTAIALVLWLVAVLFGRLPLPTLPILR